MLGLLKGTNCYLNNSRNYDASCSKMLTVNRSNSIKLKCIYLVAAFVQERTYLVLPDHVLLILSKQKCQHGMSLLFAPLCFFWALNGSHCLFLFKSCFSQLVSFIRMMFLIYVHLSSTCVALTLGVSELFSTTNTGASSWIGRDWPPSHLWWAHVFFMEMARKLAKVQLWRQLDQNVIHI